MAESCHLEIAASAAMEKTGPEQTSEEGVEEEDRVLLDELSGSVQTELSGDARQLISDEGDCQHILESDEALEGFEYIDPLTEDIDVQLEQNCEKKICKINQDSFVSQSKSTKSGISAPRNTLQGPQTESDGKQLFL